MSGEPAWKKVERAVAHFWGTERTPLSGGNSRHGTHSDTLHPKVYIELKHGRACPPTWAGILKLFADVEQKAELERKRAVLVLHPKRLPRVEEWPTYLRVEYRRVAAGEVVLGHPGIVVNVPQHVARSIVLGNGSAGMEPASCPVPDPHQRKLSV
jgi:hypothetical protein